MFRYTILAAVLTIATSSCSDPVAPVGPQNTFHQIQFVPILFQCERIELRTVDSTTRFDRVRARFKDSILVMGVLVDSVLFNGSPLTLLDSFDGEYGVDSAHIASMFTGVQQVFSTDERGTGPLHVDSVQFPAELIATSPLPGAIFSKRQGISVTWTPASDSGSVIVVDVSSTPDRPFAFLGRSTPDDGSHTIEPRFVDNEAVGNIYIFIARLHKKSAKASDGRNYWITASSVTAIQAQLVE